MDQVSYEGLVPGKEYTLDAQLISKKDGKTVLGETKGHTFTRRVLMALRLSPLP